MNIKNTSTRTFTLQDASGNIYTVPALSDITLSNALWSDNTFRKWIRYRVRDLIVDSTVDIPLAKNTIAVGTGALTTEVNLQTYTIGAGLLGTTGGVRIQAAGTVTGTTGVKDVRLKFGSATLISPIQWDAGSTWDWAFDCIVINTSATAQKVIANAVKSNNVVTFDYLTTAINTASAVVIKTTGQTAAAGDEVTSELLIVEAL